MGNLLKEWIPLILPDVELFLSDQDITAGDRWSQKVAKELNDSHFGVLCLTKENLSSDWVLFEAGALSKLVTQSAVVPLLLDLEFSDLSGPLTQFQAKKANQKDVTELLRSIRNATSSSTSDKNLDLLCQTLWPNLEQSLSDLRSRSEDESPIRTQAEILEDLVSTVRSFDVHFREIKEEVAHLYGALDIEKPDANFKKRSLEETAEHLGISKDELIQRMSVLRQRKKAEGYRRDEARTENVKPKIQTKRKRNK